MAYTGRTPAAAPLTSGDIPDGSVTPNDLSTGAPSWDTSGNVSLDGAVVINESGADVDFRIESDTNTHAFFLDGATGAVGIGTATASDMTATIYNTSSTSAGIQCQNSSTGTGTGNGFFVGIGGSGTAGTVGYIWNYENDRISFATNNTERMRIDSSGRVTMPYQPAFLVRSNGMSISHTVRTKVVLDLAITNIGSHFNTSTYRFTAPVAGMYHFQGNLLYRTGNNGRAILYLEVNGSADRVSTQAYHAGSFDQDAGGATISGDFYLNANDYVELDVYQDSGVTVSTLANEWVTFSGHLIG
jgi:hypothetical protein